MSIVRKNIRTGSFLLFISTVLFPFVASAQKTTLVSDSLGLGGDDLDVYFTNLFELALVIGAVLAVLIIATAGLQYMSGDSVAAKSSGRERIQQAVFGLLMLLGVWLFFNEINPNILNLDFNLKPTGSNTGSSQLVRQNDTNQFQQFRQNDVVSTQNNTIGSQYSNPTWTTLPTNQSCVDVQGEGWVKIDPQHCAGVALNSQSSCCGQDPNFEPQTTPNDAPLEGESFFPVANINEIPSGSWCYAILGSTGFSCYSTESECATNRVEDADASSNSCKQSP